MPILVQAGLRKSPFQPRRSTDTNRQLAIANRKSLLAPLAFPGDLAVTRVKKNVPFAELRFADLRLSATHEEIDPQARSNTDHHRRT